jgi:hypothetical protein
MGVGAVVKILAYLRERSSTGKSRGQSLVEFVVILPILLIMLSGLIEFGFLLNHYLDVIDAARDGARFAANIDPLEPDTSPPILDCVNTPYFFRLVPCVVNQALAPQIVLDPSDPPPGDTDDLVISVFVVSGTTITQRLGQDGFPDPDGWSLHGQHASNFTTAEVQAILNATPGTPPSTGIVMVEIFYDYHMVLGLPWITAFVPNPVTLHAYTLMPNTFAEPTPIPPPP